MADPALTTEAPGRLRLTGALTFDTVPRLLAGGTAPPEGEDVVLDLSGVERVDSAGLALLIDWWRRARRTGGRLRYVGAPAPLRALARVGGVEGLLGLDGEGA